MSCGGWKLDFEILVKGMISQESCPTDARPFKTPWVVKTSSFSFNLTVRYFFVRSRETVNKALLI